MHATQGFLKKGFGMLEITPATYSYPHGITLRFPGLKLAPGARQLLIGPSGSGKTSLLSMIAGFLKPHSGTVTVDGQNLFALSPRARDRLRGTHFGFVFQSMHLLPTLSLRDNVAMAAEMAGLSVDAKRLETLLQRLGVADKAHRRPDALSVGETQRAAIARAVFNQPKIILADEPTSALDDRNAATVIELLVQQAQESGASLLVATHDARIAPYFSDVLSLEPLREAA